MVESAECEWVVDSVPVPGLHGLEHRRGLTASDLADHEPGEVLPQGLRHQVRDRDVADPRAAGGLTVADSGLQGEDVLPAGLQVGHQLVVGLQGAEALVRRDGVDQGPKQGGLAGALITRDHHRLPGQDRGVEELGDLVRHQSAVGQIGQGHVGQGVLSDHHARSVRQPKPDGVQPESFTQRQRHRGVGVVERPGRLAVLTEEPDGLDQFLITVGDRRHLLPAPVTELHHHGVPAVDLDVLHIRQLQQRLQPAVAEDGILDGGDVGLLLGGGPQLGAVAVQRPNMITDHPPDGGPAHQQPVVAGQGSASGSLLIARPLR